MDRRTYLISVFDDNPSAYRIEYRPPSGAAEVHRESIAHSRTSIAHPARTHLRERPANAYNPGEKESVHITPEELQHIHEQRARRILTVAAINKAEVLILGAFGCGAFMNDPEVVASAYKHILLEFEHHFKTIEFAIYCRSEDDSNYCAFANQFRG